MVNEQLKEQLNKLRDMWFRDPVAMTVVAAIAVGAVAKLINAVSAAEGRHAYNKHVNYQIKNRRYPMSSR